MTRIVLFKGESRYGVLRQVVDCFQRAFDAAGCTTEVVDLTLPEARGRIWQLVERPELDLLFGVEVGVITLSGQRNGPIHEIVGKPLFLYRTDHPVHNHDRISQVAQTNAIVSFVDRFNAEFAAERLNVRHSLFVPHAADAAALCRTPTEQRDIPIMFAGSIDDPEAMRKLWREQLPEGTARLLENLGSYALTRQGESIHQTFREGMRSMGLAFPPESAGAAELTLIPELEQFVRCARRLELLAALDGLPVHVFGGGPWEQLLPARSFTFQGEVPFDEVTNLMGRSRIVLNNSPTIPGGLHERAFTAMMAGAMLATDASPYQEVEFPHGTTAVAYRYGQLPALADGLAQHLDNPLQVGEIAAAGQQQTVLRHTWDVRARQVLDLVAQYLA